ncbi:hypothetical protein [Streptomyces sp. NPDC005859]|uniref:hypothetical protein n=1 Tax=Streptomyces sp. NPDC005859 TaxID=3157170 RepID=UPI0033EC16F0
MRRRALARVGTATALALTLTACGSSGDTDLQPYLNTYTHLTAFHEGDTAFAHLHPTTKVNGDQGGQDLSVHAELPAAGNWRLFLQFQTGGKLHTAALTLNVG